MLRNTIKNKKKLSGNNITGYKRKSNKTVKFD
jgi:hypothetical protein